MKQNRTNYALWSLLLLPIGLTAQTPRGLAPGDVAPLKYWAAPLYWQPTRAEAHATDRTELFSAGQSNPPAQTPANSLVFVGMTPCRLVDTRVGFGFSGAFGPPSLAGAATRSFPIQASTTCSVPAIAKAYSLNVTVVPPGFMQYLTMWPMGAPQPNASTLNDSLGTVVANAAIVPAGNDASGSVNVYVSHNTDFIIDINGYYAAQSGITLTQGTASAPSLSFATDPGTGIYSSGAGVMNASVGGVQALLLGGGSQNTAVGQGALVSNTTGNTNMAAGYSALNANTSGSQNTAIGGLALQANTTGCCNAATGAVALFANTTGNFNTADGQDALASNTTGTNNTAVGEAAMVDNTTGSNNTATGQHAMEANTTGGNNTAVGYQALSTNVFGLQDTAVGYQALMSNSSGGGNTAIGAGALAGNTAGVGNIAIGSSAGFLNTSGSNMIYIGSSGAAGDSNGTVRIGNTGITNFFFAQGIYGGGSSGGVPVLINSNGQLGTSTSSRRYKEDIQDMNDVSNGLLRLRPVTFRYKQPYTDGTKPMEYGLIAEEVAEVYPDLVVKGSDGQIETVQYQKLTPLLLNELQKEHEHGERQQETIQKLEDRLAALEALLRVVH